MKTTELKPFLDELVDRYNRPDFIQDDPISIPHSFSLRQDIEISAYLASTIAWGQRVTIVKNAWKLMEIMGNSPYDFVMNSDQVNWKKIHFVHRTFNTEDLQFIVEGIKSILLKYNTLEDAFLPQVNEVNHFDSISRFRSELIGVRDAGRSSKHIANPEKGAAAKRIHMFLRWMVRSDDRGVDFGIWNKLSPSMLSCPLDVHTGNNARELGLLQRKQNDRRAVEELDNALRSMDAQDPVKYDFALFGMGVDPTMQVR